MKNFLIVAFYVLALIGIVFFKPIVALVVYHDLRCALVECRIQK